MNALKMARKGEILLAAGIVGVGVLGFIAAAMADTASTSVTVGNATPTVSSVTFNNSSAITLVENTTRTVYATSTVSDGNGCSTIVGVTTDFYRSGLTAGSCDTPGEANANNCYSRASCTVVAGSCTGGVDTAADYVCSAALQYYADPTDTGTYSAQTWTATTYVTDLSATSSASASVELNTLAALDVTSSISYGTLAANTDTGVVNSTTTVTNTGNTNIDPDLSGTNMTSGGDTIAVGQQKYSATNFTYSGGGTTLTTSPTSLNLTLPQRTSGVVTSNAYWGIGIPAGTPSGSYTGTNTFTAVAN
jgi:hypothetical protein